MADQDKKEGLADQRKSEEFLQVFKRSVQFTEELLAENERLRTRLVRLEEENRNLAKKNMSSGAYAELLEKMETLEEERKSMFERFALVERENDDYKARYREIEEEYNRLANLYIASYQLHTTLNIKEVVRITFEILINLIGSREFALYIVDKSSLVPVWSQGRSLAALPLIELGQGEEGKAAQSRKLYVSDNLSNLGKDQPAVCVPLVVDNLLLGIINIFTFLPHKTAITDLDREMFSLLGGHAAMALYSARLNAESIAVEHAATDYLKLLSS